MFGIGAGEALIIGAICCILGGGGAGAVALLFVALRPKKDERG